MAVILFLGIVIIPNSVENSTVYSVICVIRPIVVEPSDVDTI